MGRTRKPSLLGAKRGRKRDAVSESPAGVGTEKAQPYSGSVVEEEISKVRRVQAGRPPPLLRTHLFEESRASDGLRRR